MGKGREDELKRSKKEAGDAPQGRGLGDLLDAKIDPRREEIKEKRHQAGKLKKSIWTRKTRVGMDLGGMMKWRISGFGGSRMGGNLGAD